ncbi:MAG: AAA family ATPase [Rubripirellula sp.]
MSFLSNQDLSEAAMSQPANTSGTGNVDDKLDMLISRIQSLSGEEDPAQRPKQQPRPAAAPANPVRPAPPAPAQNAAAGQPAPRPQPARPARPTAVRPKGPPMPGGFKASRDEPWRPAEPADMLSAGINETLLEAIVYRFIQNIGEAEGRKIADQVKLPFGMIEPLLTRLKMEQNVAYKNSTATNDYVYMLTETGRAIARNHIQDCTYYGACPVPLREYIASVKTQTIEGQYPKRKDLLKAFSDLLINPNMLKKLGPAVASGRGMFLFGFPGNGKTSIAERVTGAFGKYVWIPRSVDVDGDILRVFDPMCHELAMPEGSGGLLDIGGFDKRWVRIERPTIIAGGELTMEMLEVQCNAESNISEAPLQLKSNCGTLVIDDFGRQKMRVDELLNRWIVPLEKRFDYLNMASGKKIQVPFDQLVVFSTNLEPKDLVDDAFLRRIPYKIEAENPPEEDFVKLFEIMCKVTKVPYKPDVIRYLIETHYKPVDRPMRMCQPRDLLLQVKNYCLYNDIPIELKNEYVDFACENYFSVM